MRFWLACFAMVFACTGCHTGLRSWLLGQKPAYLGKRDPYFDLATVDGQRRTLAAYRGKIVVLAIGATWCPPCRQEIPALKAYAPEAASRGIALVAIDTGEAAAPVAALIEKTGIRYPVFLDPQQRYWHYYDVTAIPEIVVLNRAGIPVKAYTGEFDRPAVERIIASIPPRP